MKESPPRQATDSFTSVRDIMSSDIETVEGRLTSLLGQLQAECGILDRMVYKNKNQHRRCSYFQYLLKVCGILILHFYSCLLTNSKCKLGLT